MSVEEIMTAALQLGPTQRAQLAQTLLSSLEDLSDAERMALWTAEAARRDSEWASNDGSAHAAEDVLRSARQAMA